MTTRITTVAVLNELLQAWPAAMPELVQPRPAQRLLAQIRGSEAELQAAFAHADANALGCIRAGLYLLADDLDTAHRLCQDIDTIWGSAWHAVMHRREGDFSNSKYWWRRAEGITWAIPDGPTLAETLRKQCAESDLPEATKWEANLAGGYNPAAFVDVVASAHARGTSDPWYQFLVQSQRHEWLTLFARTLRVAEKGRG